ncbi:MAG: nucleoside-diphosphate kinase [Halobacteriales archaeon]
MTERTFVMAKPDAVQRGLVGQLIDRLESRGLKLLAAKVVKLDEDTAAEHYAEHVDKPFYDDLLEFITSGPVVPMVWEGEDATRQVRQMIGATDPLEASPGTIRGDYALDLGRNVVHAADHEDPGANEREIEIHFDEDELVAYDRLDEAWLYE